MKILHYAGSISRSAGGLYYSVSGLAKSLAARGMDVTVAGGIDAHFDKDRHAWGDLPLITQPIQFGQYGLNPPMLAKIANAPVDIVHIHGIWASGSVYARAASLLGKRVVISPRGMLDPWILRRKPQVKAAHAALFERPLFRRSHVHALNEAEYEAVVTYMPELRERTFVVPNGVDPAGIQVPASGKSGMLFLGRLHQKKQVLELVRAWKAHRLEGERLTIAGWGEKPFEDEVRALCAEVEGVDFVGPLYGDEKAQMLARSRWFILPSLSEGLPMAALEALQYGCIPILTRECNLWELFRNGTAIELKSDLSDFGDLIGRLQAMPEVERDALAAKCLKAADDYAWPHIADQMITHYDQVMARQAA